MSAGGYTFLDRHPEAGLLPFAVCYGFTAYLDVAKVATSRGPVGAAWLPSMLIGAGCAVALLALIVVRHRAGKVDWLMVSPMVIVLVGLLTTKSAVWAVPRPPGLVTTAFENAELALCGLLSLGVVLSLGWFYRKTGENRMAARRAARTPVDELHISRATTWRDSEANPIARDEWEEVAERNGLGLFDPHSDQAREAANILPGSAAPQKMFTLTRADGSRLILWWNNSQVSVIGISPDWAADVVLIAPLARTLNARVYGR